MRTSVLLVILCLFLSPIWANAAEKSFDMEIGVRGGKNDSSNNEDFDAAEIYFLKQLPWGTTFGEQTTLTSRFDIAATYLDAAGNDGVMLAAGADLVLGLWAGCMELEIGFRPTWMFDHEYGKEDFGGGMQFTNHVGLTVNRQPVVFTYRFQHVSNGGIYDQNPGLNLHLIGLGYRF